MSFKGYNSTQEYIKDLSDRLEKLVLATSNERSIRWNNDGYYEINSKGFHARCGKEFMKALINHPLQGTEVTEVWVDECSDWDKPKKKHKPKQQMPYWAVDWRNK